MAIERIVPGTKDWEAFYANHILRYQFAANILKDAEINNLLDAACGVGYGSAFMAKEKNIKSIVAIDRSAEALKLAETNFSTPKVKYLADDCHTLQEASNFGKYDAIVSFETFEHLPKPMDFLKACFNNLNPTGKLIISTPNKSVSSPDELNWEYHEKEYTASEFYQSLQQAGYNNIKLYGQQFNMKGKIKNELRGDLNRIYSNPFVRAGLWLQEKLKGYKRVPVLKESIDDFEIIFYNTPAECEVKGKEGPFVLIATAAK